MTSIISRPETVINCPASPPKGVIIWEGNSLLTGAPIVAIATGLARRSKNRKTGAMVQTWILDAERDPVDAIATGANVNVCGDCPLAPLATKDGVKGGACYVNTGQAPLAIWRAWKDGAYVPLSAYHREYFQRRPLRLGAYGEPVAVPLSAWRPLLRWAPSRTGYTHQWRQRRFRYWAPYVMASCETVADVNEARRQGWRTFRSTLELGDRMPREILCPASPEGGARTNCAKCTLCDGRRKDGDTRRDIVILAHGSQATLGAYRQRFDR